MGNYSLSLSLSLNDATDSPGEVASYAVCPISIGGVLLTLYFIWTKGPHIQCRLCRERGSAERLQTVDVETYMDSEIPNWGIAPLHRAAQLAPINVDALISAGRLSRRTAAQLSKDDWTCCVCLEGHFHNTITGASNVVKLRCCHALHLKCLRSWINQGRRECPVCRHTFDEQVDSSSAGAPT